MFFLSVCVLFYLWRSLASVFFGAAPHLGGGSPQTRQVNPFNVSALCFLRPWLSSRPVVSALRSRRCPLALVVVALVCECWLASLALVVVALVCACCPASVVVPPAPRSP
jgi:hypothetical protein